MKNYNKKLLISLFSILLLTAGMNYFINPYNIFAQHFFKTMLKPEAKVQERLTKPIGLKVDKRKISAVFMGTSRTDLAINKDDYKLLTGENAEVIAIGGLEFSEIEKMISIALKTHPEINKIYMAIDFQTFNKNQVKIIDNRSEITENPKLTAQEFSSALLSVSTLGNSVWTIVKNLLKIEERMFYYQGHKHIFVNPKIQKEFAATKSEYSGRYKGFGLDLNELETLKTYVGQLRSSGIEVKMFIMPTHITVQNLITETGKRKEYDLWRSKLAEISDVWDFNIPNQYTQEEIKPDMQYFFDGSHSTHNFGKIIISDLLTDKPAVATLIPKKEGN